MKKSKNKIRIKEMYKPNNNDISFYVWMMENWTVTGGLITQVVAARLLRKTGGRIKQMINAGKLREYRYQNMSFLSYAEIMKMARQFAYEEATQAIATELNKLEDKLEDKLPKNLMEQLQVGIEDIINLSQDITQEK